MSKLDRMDEFRKRTDDHMRKFRRMVIVMYAVGVPLCFGLALAFVYAAVRVVKYALGH